MSKGEKLVLLFAALLLCAGGVLLLTGGARDGYTISALPEPEPLPLPEEASGLVDLNTAGAEELMTLPGIGETRAEQILAWREENGAFELPEDIMEVPGIGESIFEGLRDCVTVETK